MPWAGTAVSVPIEPDPGACVGALCSVHPLVPGAGAGALVPELVPGAGAGALFPELVPGAGAGALGLPAILVPGAGSLLWSPGKSRSGRVSGNPVPVSSGAWAKSNLNFLAFATGMSCCSSWPNWVVKGKCYNFPLRIQDL